jgi:hypothetical protein
MGRDEITVKEQTTYLGVLFEGHLNWEPHISKKVLAAKKHLMTPRGIVRLARLGDHRRTSCAGYTPA